MHSCQLRKEGWSYRLFLPSHIPSGESGYTAPWLWGSGSGSRKFLLFNWSPSGFPNKATALSTALGSCGSFTKALAWPISQAGRDITWAASLLWLRFLVSPSLSHHHQPCYINKGSRTENTARASFHPGSDKGTCCSFLLLPASLFHKQNLHHVSHARCLPVFKASGVFAEALKPSPRMAAVPPIARAWRAGSRHKSRVWI